MRALFDDVAVVEHEDEVGVLDGREAVGDDEARAALREGVHRRLDGALGAGVDV